MACSPSACADIIKRVRRSGQAPQFLSLSNVNSSEFMRDLGADGRGVGIMQVMPYPGDLGAAIVREFRRALKETGNPVPLSYPALEGFAAAKLTVQALRQAGPNPSRASMLAALESLHECDLGGIAVRYAPGRHEASRFVELVVIGKNGALWR
jgi:ABC-type branched-subunit amino acid transport system substrate-binding protein